MKRIGIWHESYKYMLTRYAMLSILHVISKTLQIDFLHTWTDGHKLLCTSGKLTRCLCSCRCGLPKMNMMSPAHPLCTGSVSRLKPLWVIIHHKLFLLHELPGHQVCVIPTSSWICGSLAIRRSHGVMDEQFVKSYATLNSIHCMLSQKQFSLGLTVRDNISPASTNFTEWYKFITLEFHGKCGHLPSALFVWMLT